MSYDYANQTNLIPQQLYSETLDATQSIQIDNQGIVLGGDLLTTPIYATLDQNGVSTTNPNGFNILNTLNMNTNGITNLNSITSTDDLTINTDINFIVNSDYSVILNSNGTYINQIGGGGGDGQITANTFNGNLNGNANYATSSGSSSNTQSIQVNLNTANATNYLTFSDGYTTSLRSLRSNSGLTYNPSTNVLSATTFTGGLSGTATNATNCFTQFTSTSATYYPVFTSSNSTGYYSQNVGTMTYNPSSNTITANTFNGLLSGTATNATNVGITSDNTSGTYYIPFTKTSGTGNKPLYQDDTTGPLSYNPSTSTLSATNFSGLLDTGGLVYLSTGSQAITGSASATNISLTGIFNSTYKNYRIVLYPTTQVSFTSYPAYSLTAFLGTGTLPTTASLYGFEISSASSAVVSPVYTSSATISSAPLVLAVSQLTNHQTIIEVENVGFTASATQSIGLKCKSIYSNPGVSGASDRTISAVNVSGSTITGLTLQQSSISVSNNMTIGWTIYGYK